MSNDHTAYQGRSVALPLRHGLSLGLLVLLLMAGGGVRAQDVTRGDEDLDSLLSLEATPDPQPAASPAPADAAPQPAAPLATIPVEAVVAEPAEEIPQSDIAKRRALEEITVTATKRSIDIRDVPLSITAFDGDELRAIGATNLESMARFTPGVAVSPGLDPEAAQVIIRGVATDTFFTFFTRTFGLFYEDVSLVNPSILGPQPNLDPFDMNVEILKGPQGTLFGGSALSGAVRYVPNRPDYDAAYGKVAAGVGTLARSGSLTRRYDGMANLPLGDSVAVRVVGSRNSRPGYINDLRSGQEDINSSDSSQIRGLISWRATDKLELRFNALRRKTHQDDGAFASTVERPEHANRFLPDTLSSTTDSFSLTTDYDIDFASVVMILSKLNKEYPQTLDYSQFFGTSTAGIGTYGKTGVRSAQPSAELRLVSARRTESSYWALKDWDYVAGYFFVYSDQFLDLNIGTQAAGDLLRLRGDVDAKENAVFFDLTRHLGERWELGFGGRLFKQSTTADIGTTVTAVAGVIESGPLASLLLPVSEALREQGGIDIGRDVGRVSETVFNPKLTALFRYNEDITLFASAIKGFRYAGANQNPTRDPNVPLFFKSDNIWNYETGVRTRWFGGALQADLTFYQLEWTDLQVQQREFTGAFAYSTNVGGARNRGVELGIDLLLPAGFALKLAGSYVDARTTTFFDDFQGPAPAGTELPGSSPLSGSALLLFARPIGTTQLTSTVSYTYQNRSFNNLPHTYRQPALALLGASVGLSLPSLPGRPVINLVGNNLTNEFKPGVVFDTPNTGGILTIFNPPRSIMLGIELSFGQAQ